MDDAEELASLIAESEVYTSYQESKKKAESDQRAQQLIKHFLQVRDKYDEVQRFGRYHPDFKQVMKEMMVCKRELDLYPLIAEYKKEEKRLNELLGEVSALLASSVSSSIKVPTGDPFFDRSCGTGCGSGGACGCHSRKSQHKKNKESKKIQA
nr:YlbF family regulator [Sporolactobacillus mangiferae]